MRQGIWDTPRQTHRIPLCVHCWANFISVTSLQLCGIFHRQVNHRLRRENAIFNLLIPNKGARTAHRLYTWTLTSTFALSQVQQLVYKEGFSGTADTRIIPHPRRTFHHVLPRRELYRQVLFGVFGVISAWTQTLVGGASWTVLFYRAPRITLWYPSQLPSSKIDGNVPS